MNDRTSGASGVPLGGAEVVRRIQGRLDRLGLSPEDASRRAGAAPDALGRVLDGKAPLPRGARLRKLAEALDCSVSYLVGLEPDAPPPEDLLAEDQGALAVLPPDQEALLRAYNRLDMVAKQALLLVANRMAGPDPVAQAKRR